MSSFEFLSVLISVVVGLGIANILTGIGRLIHREAKMELSPNFVAWTLFVSFYMVVYWWTVVFGWQALQNWNLVMFMFVLAYGLILYLLSVILFPTDMPENWEPGTHIIRKRHWFYGVFLALVVIEFLDSYLKGHLDDFSAPYYVLMTVWATGGILAWTSRKKRVHDIVAIIVVVSQVAWVSYQLSDLEWSLAG
jgi:hypothetical protein